MLRRPRKRGATVADVFAARLASAAAPAQEPTNVAAAAGDVAGDTVGAKEEAAHAELPQRCGADAVEPRGGASAREAAVVGEPAAGDEVAARETEQLAPPASSSPSLNSCSPAPVAPLQATARAEQPARPASSPFGGLRPGRAKRSTVAEMFAARLGATPSSAASASSASTSSPGPLAGTPPATADTALPEASACSNGYAGVSSNGAVGGASASRATPPLEHAASASSSREEGQSCREPAASSSAALVEDAETSSDPNSAVDGGGWVSVDDTGHLSCDTTIAENGQQLASDDGQLDLCMTLEGDGSALDSFTDGGAGDFELWVETDINPAWCLEDGSGKEKWRAECQTAFLRRRWEEFEAMGQQVIAGSTELTYHEALDLLGLSENPNPAQVATAFRQQSRSCHPDKIGPSDKFEELVAAYQVIQRSIAGKGVKRP